MDLLTVVNRTDRDLSGTWDGKQYVIKPGKSMHPAIIAEALKRSNPVMGSDDPLTGQLQYLIGIEEQGDPTDPIEQSNEIELYNRRLMKNAVPVVVIPGNTGMYSVRRSEVSGQLPSEAGFVKP